MRIYKQSRYELTIHLRTREKASDEL